MQVVRFLTLKQKGEYYMKKLKHGLEGKMSDKNKIRELLNNGYTWQEVIDYFKYLRWKTVSKKDKEG